MSDDKQATRKNRRETQARNAFRRVRELAESMLKRKLSPNPEQAAWESMRDNDALLELHRMASKLERLVDR
jgi:hypothetical protein